MKKLGIRKVGVLALAVAIANVGMTACNKQDGTEALNQRAVGGIGFKLSLPAGISVQEVEYTISGPGAFSKDGKIPLGGTGNTFSAKIDGLPAGKGYTIKLSADEGGGSECVGSASFDVVANQTTSVSVKLLCPGKKSGGGTGDGMNGSVVINGVINFCPVVESATATPAGTGTYNLIGLGTDRDSSPAPLSYKWTADGGATLSGTNAANVTLTCPSTGGKVSVIFEVMDGTTAEGGCTDKLLLADVNCTPCTDNCGGTSGTGATGGAGTDAVGGAGTDAVGGAGTGTTGGAGTDAVGGAGTGTTGGAGTGTTGGAGTGTTGGAGTGIGGSTGGEAACTACEMKTHESEGVQNTNCLDSTASCDGLAAPKNTLCRAVLKCMHEKKCAGTAATDCLCGTGRDPNDCFTGTVAAATGPCKAEVIAAAETMESSATVMTDLQNRFFDTTYGIGAAAAVIETCDQFFCKAECL